MNLPKDDRDAKAAGIRELSNAFRNAFDRRQGSDDSRRRGAPGHGYGSCAVEVARFDRFTPENDLHGREMGEHCL